MDSHELKQQMLHELKQQMLHELKQQMLHGTPFEEELICFSKVMFVDPGIRGTGMAFWQHLSTQAFSLGCARTRSPYTVARWVPRPKRPWADRASEITSSFLHVVDMLRPEILVIERPQVWMHSAKSMEASAHGDLQKLRDLIIMLEKCALDMIPELMVVFFTPNEWKGQLSKEAVDAWINRATREKYAEHVSDAVGMGLAVQGVFREGGGF
jgi:hypothetical protein